MRTLFTISALALVIGCDGTTKPTDSGDAPASNNAPTAEAGAAITQSADLAVQLNGGASTDPDGDTLTFHWTFDRVPDGSSLPDKEKPFSSNNTSDATQPTFQPDRVGTYIIKLVVNDGHVDSGADFVIVTVTEPEDRPVANAGLDVTGAAGTLITLDGSTSYDPQGRTLTYAWTLVDKPSASALSSLTAADTSAPSFTPDARGNYTVNLVVNNGLTSSVADAAVVTATGDDGAPVANAGEDQSVEDCTSIPLSCTASVDPDGDTLTYFWSIQSKPGNSVASETTSLSDRTSGTPTFWPDQAGKYVLSCAVYDGKNWSTPDLLTLDAAERHSNSQPVADAGADQSVSGGNAECTESGYVYNCDECASTTVNLGADARASDPDSDPYTMKWSVVSGDATITNDGVLSTTATLSEAEPTEPGKCEDVEYTFKLEVTDCTGETTTDNVKFTLSCCGVEDTGP